ncbi:UNVERIFIED_CONTAM: NADPh quinone reductase [Siphonaria sp. JEL0065]|nr:NADPh quinone reductase [Siphonaria sp. JEL0065]
MRAVIMKKMGCEDDLELAIDLPRPSVEADTIIVKVAACGVTSANYKILTTWAPPPLYRKLLVLPMPVTAGVEFAGTVVEVGSSVADFAVGDEVYGCKAVNQHGTYTEFISIKPNTQIIFHRPVSVPVEVAAGAMRDPMIVYCGLVRSHGLSLTDKPGEKSVLVLGADTDKGMWAVMISKRLGALVTAVVEPGREKFGESIGADHVYESINLVDGKFDVLFDSKGENKEGSHWKLAQRVIKAFGLFSFTAESSGDHIETKKLKRTFTSTITYSPAVFRFDAKESSSHIAEWLEDGSISGIPVTTFPLEDAKEVHLKRLAGEIAGKSVFLLEGLQT